jgi:hypothetical protein
MGSDRVNDERDPAPPSLRSGLFAQLEAGDVPVLQGGPQGWLVDLDPPQWRPAEGVALVSVHTWATVHGDLVEVTGGSGGEATIFVDGYPEWVQALDATFDRNEQGCVVAVPISWLSSVREVVRPYPG